MDLRVQAFQNILAQSGAYFDDQTPQKLVNRLAFDVQKIQAVCFKVIGGKQIFGGKTKYKFGGKQNNFFS